MELKDARVGRVGVKNLVERVQKKSKGLTNSSMIRNDSVLTTDLIVYKRGR